MNLPEKKISSFEIDMKYAWELFQKQKGKCALSGKEIILDRNNSCYFYCKGQQTASLDRIDSSKGYCIGNVQWVHVILNRMKSNLEESDFIHWCKAVNDYNNVLQ